eukprot:Platyproteum_vivax@DN3795_c0_g1_i1.p1
MSTPLRERIPEQQYAAPTRSTGSTTVYPQYPQVYYPSTVYTGEPRVTHTRTYIKAPQYYTPSEYYALAGMPHSLSGQGLPPPVAVSNMGASPVTSPNPTRFAAPTPSVGSTGTPSARYLNPYPVVTPMVGVVTPLAMAVTPTTSEEVVVAVDSSESQKPNRPSQTYEVVEIPSTPKIDKGVLDVADLASTSTAAPIASEAYTVPSGNTIVYGERPAVVAPDCTPIAGRVYPTCTNTYGPTANTMYPSAYPSTISYDNPTYPNVYGANCPNTYGPDPNSNPTEPLQRTRNLVAPLTPCGARTPIMTTTTRVFPPVTPTGYFPGRFNAPVSAGPHTVGQRNHYVMPSTNVTGVSPMNTCRSPMVRYPEGTQYVGCTGISSSVRNVRGLTPLRPAVVERTVVEKQGVVEGQDDPMKAHYDLHYNQVFSSMPNNEAYVVGPAVEVVGQHNYQDVLSLTSASNSLK